MPDINFTVQKLREIANREEEPEEIFSSIIQEIATFYIEAFNLQDTEVAIFLSNEEKSILSFAYPEHLVNAGMIPVSSSDAIVSMIFRTQRSFIDNNFAQQKHLSIFEQIKAPGKTSLPIWKLMGTLITLIDDNIGVIELSRRAPTFAEAGRDFTDEDVDFLKMTMIQLAPFIRKVMPRDFRGRLT